jgi:ABC-type antimicrobial peptide transport system permease subunit
MVIGQGLTLAAAGGIAGLLGAAAATRVLRRFLFGVTPLDPYVFAELVVVLIVVALAASYLPARRASRVDPAIALRN